MTADVIFEEIAAQGGAIGVISLNRPKVLNALNHQMFLQIDKQLTVWENQAAIKAVLIRSTNEKAFCAGGDIREAYELGLARDPRAQDFFRDEYHLNRHIFHYKKPYIALLDGITMGGGAGVSLHGRIRIATQHLSFAMPETGIGFFPDVGGTYFLPRLPHYMGFYLGLTGARIGYADCFALGLIDYFIPRLDIAKWYDQLAGLDLSKDGIVSLTQQLSSVPEAPPLFAHQQVIARCFSQQTMQDIFLALAAEGSEWCLQTIELLQKKSPTSLSVTLEALQKGATMDFDACMDREFQLTCQFLSGRDFYEGVRAVIIDKDQSPRWML